MLEQNVMALLNTAADFHGHLGPFLALGIRTSLAGLRELNAVAGDTRLQVTVMLKHVVPFSCMLDGVQTVTKCTLGNKRLSWRESEEMGAVFTLKDSARVEIIVDSSVVRELSRRLAKEPSEENVRQIALDIASRSEKDLLVVKRKRYGGSRYQPVERNHMHDLGIAKDLLKNKNDTLVIVKKMRVLFETGSPGIRGLLTAIEKLGKELHGSSVADKIVGEAAAQLCAYSKVARVFAATLSKCGKDLLERHNISYEYENIVPHILNSKKIDLCPFEKKVAGSRSPEEAYEKLRQCVQLLP